MKTIKKLFEKSFIGTRLFNIMLALTLAFTFAGSWFSLFYVVCIIMAIADKGEERSKDDNNG